MRNRPDPNSSAYVPPKRELHVGGTRRLIGRKIFVQKRIITVRKGRAGGGEGMVR
jgi:hypothetical protein